MNWLGIHEWVWILIFCYFGTIILNPILFFIKWEIYERKRWILDKESRQFDARFFKYKDNKSSVRIQIAPVRPQIKDVAYENDDYFYWWFPVTSYFVFLYLLLYLICRPFRSGWKLLIRKIGELKV